MTRGVGTGAESPDAGPMVMISCGEPSGDLYAGALAAEIRRAEPDARIFGLGGDRLEAAGGTLVAHYRGLTVTGLTEAIRILPRSLAVYRRLVGTARRCRPDVFVAVDFPDFNFRLAGALRRMRVPVVYYVTPQVWAWRRHRFRTLQRLADRLLVIFPFEEALYRPGRVPVEFVGHPLRDLTATAGDRRAFLSALGFDPAGPTVALLPGSRPNELRAILPVLVQAAQLILRRVPQAQFLIARAPGLDDAAFAAIEAIPTPAVRLLESQTDAVLASADVGLIASGTATVQAAIHDCPMVVVYRLGPLTYRLGKPFVHVSTYAMVNLVAGRRVVPELVQEAFTPEATAAEAIALLTDPDRAAAMRRALADVRAKLGAPGASGRAAAAVLAVARGAGAKATAKR